MTNNKLVWVIWATVEDTDGAHEAEWSYVNETMVVFKAAAVCDDRKVAVTLAETLPALSVCIQAMPLNMVEYIP